jgi:tryptophan synthase alpha chain
MPKKLMAHMVYGYPDQKISKTLFRRFDSIGASYIEVQIPFSDPIADGTVLANANSQASAHVSTAHTLQFLHEQIPKLQTSKVVVMCYFQTIFAFGIDRFCSQLAGARVYGLIVPDLPYDQTEFVILKHEAAAHLIVLIPVLSPNVNPARLRHYAEPASKLIYLTARSGITGTHTSSKKIKDISDSARQIKQLAPDCELALGFGIQTPTDIIGLPDIIDIAVVGSALTVTLDEFGADAAIDLAQNLLRACDSAASEPK